MFLSIVLLASQATAQLYDSLGFKQRSPLQYTLRGNVGWLVLPGVKKPDDTPSSNFGFDLTSSRYLKSKTGWERYLNFPRWGLMLQYRNYRSNKLGSAYGILMQYIFHANLAKNFYWEFNPAAGIGYLPKKFDPISNPSNRLIGSRYNVGLYIRTGLRYDFGKLGVIGGFSLSHYSNGHSSLPNFGVNAFE